MLNIKLLALNEGKSASKVSKNPPSMLLQFCVEVETNLQNYSENNKSSFRSKNMKL